MQDIAKIARHMRQRAQIVSKPHLRETPRLCGASRVEDMTMLTLLSGESKSRLLSFSQIKKLAFLVLLYEECCQSCVLISSLRDVISL